MNILRGFVLTTNDIERPVKFHSDPVKKPWFHRVNNCVLLENGHPTFNRESLFHGYFYHSLRNWVDEFIPYYMGTPVYIVSKYDSILLAVAAVSGGSGPPKVQRCNIEVEHVTAES